MGGSTPREWDAEVVVDDDLARQLIQTQCPDVAAADVRHVATGWDNTVFLVDDVWLFRFPRREIAIAGVLREILVLPTLALLLPAAIPEPVNVGRPGEAFGWPFWGARRLDGSELAQSGLPDDERAELGRSVGAFLRALHAVPPEPAWELPVDPMRRGDPTHRAAMARPHLGRMRAAGLAMPSEAAFEQVLGQVPAGPPGPLVLTHGDLHVRHLLVDDFGHLAGVIDWGDICVADPSVDLIIAYLGFAGAAREALLDAYGSITRDQEMRARVAAVSVGAALADQAMSDGVDWLLDEALRALARTVAVSEA